MTKLEDINPCTKVTRVVLNQTVQVTSVEWIGDQAIIPVYRETNGGVSETIL